MRERLSLIPFKIVYTPWEIYYHFKSMKGSYPSQKELTVLNGIFDGTQPVPYRIFDLCQSVLIWPLDQQGDRARVNTVLNKGELFFTLTDRTRVYYFNM